MAQVAYPAATAIPELVLERGLCKGEVFFGSYAKPLPYFFPMVDVLEHAIKRRAIHSYSARVFVDGIDGKKAAELTNALRVRGVSLDQVRSRRDESEPLIRLADMWAGCIREAGEGSPEEQALVKKALATEYLYTHTAKPPEIRGF